MVACFATLRALQGKLLYVHPPPDTVITPAAAASSAPPVDQQPAPRLRQQDDEAAHKGSAGKDEEADPAWQRTSEGSEAAPTPPADASRLRVPQQAAAAPNAAASAPAAAPSLMSLLMSSGFSKYTPRPNSRLAASQPAEPGPATLPVAAPRRADPTPPEPEPDEPRYTVVRPVTQRPREGVVMDNTEQRFQRSREVGVHIMRGAVAAARAPTEEGKRLSRKAAGS